MNFKKFKALIFLGFHFLLHVFKRLFSFFQSPNGAHQFLSHYKSDHIFALTKDNRLQIPSFETCVSCRICDMVCPQFDTSNSLSSPSYLVMGYSRLMADYNQLGCIPLDCKTCTACEKACPENVPIKSIISFVKQHA